MATRSPLQEACELILQTINKLDPTGDNGKRYQRFFASMKPAELEAYLRKFCDNPDDNFYIEVLPYHNEPSFREIKAAAAFLKVPLKEYATFPDQGNVTTAYPVPVGYIQVKRQQQIVSKKNSMASSINQRNAKTGQVISGSKAARASDMDNYSLQTISADSVMKELLGARADAMEGKSRLYQQLAQQGYANQADINSDPTRKVALRTVDMLYLCCGIKTNLINNSMVLPVVADRRSGQRS